MRVQLHFESVTEVTWCSEADQPGLNCSSPVLKRQETEQALEWPEFI